MKQEIKEAKTVKEVKEVKSSIIRDIIYLLRDFLIVDVKEFLKNILSTVKALLRLVLLTVTFFFSGLNNVLFAGREICDFDFVFDYLKQDLDKLSYIDKLNAQIGDFEDDMEDGYIIIEGEEDEED